MVTPNSTFTLSLLRVPKLTAHKRKKKANIMNYKSQSARDALKMYSKGYAYYIEAKALEYAERFPERAEYFMNRSLGEVLAGNDGE